MSGIAAASRSAPQIRRVRICGMPVTRRRSGGLQDEMRLEAGVVRTGHHWAEEHSLEAAAVIGEVAVGLAEGWHDLGHFEPKHTVFIGERRAVAVWIAFVAFGGMSPDLDALTGQRRAVTGATHGAGHPE